MAKLNRKNGATSNILRVFLMDSTSTTGAGKTGLTSSSGGLIISTIADNEATATTYTSAGSTTETITTLGTFAAPTATKCRFKEVDATNFPGVYEIQIADARFAVSSAKALLVSVQCTGVAPVYMEIDHSGQVDTVSLSGTAQTARDIGASVLLSTGTGTGQLDFTSGVVKANTTQFAGSAITSASGVPEVKVQSIAANAITATSINADAITAAKVADGTIDAATFAAGAINAAAIADGAIDRATFAADTGMQTARSNTAAAGASSSITLDASASAVDNYYKGMVVYITGGTGVGQTRLIVGYVGSTQVASVSQAWATNPDNTSTFAIRPVGPSDIRGIAGAAVSTTTAQLGVNVVSMSNNAVTAAAIATDAIDADALAADAVAEIADGVWDEATAGHTTAGTTGKALTDASSAGDPWSTALPGAYGAGTAGKLVGDNVNASIAAVKAKTDSLTFTVANQVDSNVKSNAGTAITAAAGIQEVKVASMAAGSVTAAAIADGAIDRATFAADTGLQSIRSNTAAAGAATTITLDASASATNDIYKDSLIYITGGTGVGQLRLCISYVGATQVATVSHAWATNPDNTSTFAILPVGPAALRAIAGAALSTTTAQLGVNTVQAAGTAWNSGAITASTIATDAIDADAIAADAVTEIQNGLATPTNITAGTITTVTNLTNAPTNGDLTATMKTSVTTACTASTPTAAAVTGAVGSVAAGGITAASIATGAVDADALATDAVTEITDAILALVIETGLTLKNVLRLCAAAAAGKLSGAATTTVVLRNAAADDKNRITATVDADGNRSAVTLDLT